MPRNGPSVVQTSLHSVVSIPIYESPVRQYIQPDEQSKQEEGHADSTPFIPGGGLTRRILTSIPENWSIPTAAILQFAMEGDNRADANLLATVIAEVLHLDISSPEWQQPRSWQEGLFGTPHDQTLYG